MKKIEKEPLIITKQEAVETMKRSGYLLESRISALLRSRAWIVESNSIYMDYATGKSREIDVHAIGGSSIYDDERGFSFVFQHLLIECIHPPQPTVFIKADGLLNERKAELIKIVSNPSLIWNKKNWRQIPAHLELHNFHHYTTAPLASQFCSFSRKNGADRKWMAHHDESQFGAFVALGQAIEFHLQTNTLANSKRATRSTRTQPPHIEIFYPVLVIEGELWSIDQTQDEPTPS